MRSRAVRITLTLLAFAAAGAAAYSYWTTHIRINATIDRAEAFTQARQSAIRAIFDVRSAQQAYVAAGQNEAFWFQKVSTSIESLRAALDDLEKATNSIDARGAVTEIAATLQEFEDADRRVRGYVSTEQRLLASDIIFSDGYDLTARILTELDRAAGHAREEVAASRAAAAREQMIAAGAGIGVALLVALLLAPVSSEKAAETPLAATRQPAAQASSLELDLRPAAAPVVKQKPAAAVAPKPSPPPPDRTAPKAGPAPPPGRGLELTELARVCTELARLSDSTSMPAILERAVSALHASGLVLWVSDAERKQLIPIATHGYASNVLSRLGVLAIDSENATAAAFRTSLVQTVRGDQDSNGAIAAPLVSPTGCLGVMSVEVRDGGEKEPARLAAASIVAAQLATIVGPPPARAEEPNSAAL